MLIDNYTFESPVKIYILYNSDVTFTVHGGVNCGKNQCVPKRNIS